MTTPRLPTGFVVRVVVTEPWEFDAGPLTGTVLRMGIGADAPDVPSMLIRLSQVVTFKGKPCEYFVARPRRKELDLDVIAEGSDVDCNLTCVSPQCAGSSGAFDLSRWRGGVGLIATISKGL